MTTSLAIGLVKLGHPQPDSNLSLEENRGSPVATSTYIPLSKVFQYSFEKARSVSFSWVTAYCSGVSFFFSSSFVGFGYLLSSIIGFSAFLTSIWQYPLGCFFK